MVVGKHPPSFFSLIIIKLIPIKVKVSWGKISNQIHYTLTPDWSTQMLLSTCWLFLRSTLFHFLSEYCNNYDVICERPKTNSSCNNWDIVNKTLILYQNVTCIFPHKIFLGNKAVLWNGFNHPHLFCFFFFVSHSTFKVFTETVVSKLV